MFYVVGVDPLSQMYRLLRIERNHSTSLRLIVDDTEYDRTQINSVLDMIRGVNANTGGLHKCLTAYGIIG